MANELVHIPKYALAEIEAQEENPSEETKQIAKEVEILKSEIEHTEKLLYTITEHIEDTVKHLNLQPEVKTLNNYLAELKKEIDSEEIKKIKNKENSPEVEIKEPTISEDPMEGVKGSFDISKEVKQLFKKIANKTHPDRTADKQLHAIFIEAKILAKINNYEGLREVWDALKEGKSRYRKKVEARRAIFRRKKKEIEAKYKEILSSDGLVIHKAMTSQGTEVAKFYLLKVLKHQIDESVEKLKKLRGQKTTISVKEGQTLEQSAREDVFIDKAGNKFFFRK